LEKANKKKNELKKVEVKQMLDEKLHNMATAVARKMPRLSKIVVKPE